MEGYAQDGLGGLPSDPFVPQFAARSSKMQYSDELLNTYWARDLSQLTSPSFPAVAALANQSIVFALNYALGSLKFREPATVQAITAAMNHNSSAVRSYRLARDGVESYTSVLPDHNNIHALIQALSDLESCLLHTHIAALCLNEFQRATTGKRFLQKTDTTSEYARLREIGNRIKHFDEDVGKALKARRKSPARAIWLSNTDIHCRRCSITYSELANILTVQSQYVIDFTKDPTMVPIIMVE